MKPKMTASELRAHVENTGSPFFSHGNMKFSGDTMRNYGCAIALVQRHNGEKTHAWELYRKKPVAHGLKKSAFFDVETFKQIHPAEVLDFKE